METTNPIVPWSEIDTILVDMDGTLLDLAFDSFFWMDLIPSHYAALHQLAKEEVRGHLLERYRAKEGTLDWYCIDHWTEALGLDIRALKRANRHRIRYLPKAVEFLESVRARGKRLLLVTNAHRDTLAIKVGQTGLDKWVDGLISSHDFHFPKETQQFWTKFVARENIDPQRTLFIEDNVEVLQNARAFGVKFLIAIQKPDSRYPAKPIDSFPAVDGVADLLGDQ